MPEGQSPVDIPPTAPVHGEGLELRYGPIPLVLGHNPTAVQVDNTGDAGARIDGQPYELVQLHLHHPSEHTFSGTHTAMELHFVHQTVAGELAVVAVTFVEGPANPALADILAAVTGGMAPGTVDLRPLVPADRAHVAYVGSLTTPPYAEGVAWRVLIRPSTLSAEQLGTLRATKERNARPVQPLAGRTFLPTGG